MKIKIVMLITAFFSIVGWGPFNIFRSTHTASSYLETTVGSKYWIDKTIKTLQTQASNLNPEVLKVGINAYLKAQQLGLEQKQVFTLVDYSKSSAERRLWVIDMKNLKVLFNTWVAHGSNSGKEKSFFILKHT